MNNCIKSIKSTFVTSGIFLGYPCIEIQFDSHKEYNDKIEVCLNSNVTKYYDNLNPQDITDIFQNYTNEFIFIKNGLSQKDYLKEILPYFRENSNFILISDSVTDFFEDIKEYIDFYYFNLSFNPNICDFNERLLIISSFLEKFKDTPLSVHLLTDIYTQVEQVIELSQSINKVRDDVCLVLEPFPVIDEFNDKESLNYKMSDDKGIFRVVEKDQKYILYTYPLKDMLLSLCQYASESVECRVIFNM